MKKDRLYRWYFEEKGVSDNTNAIFLESATLIP
jgi:hypothetical protein